MRRTILAVPPQDVEPALVGVLPLSVRGLRGLGGGAIPADGTALCSPLEGGGPAVSAAHLVARAGERRPCPREADAGTVDGFRRGTQVPEARLGISPRALSAADEGRGAVRVVATAAVRVA